MSEDEGENMKVRVFTETELDDKHDVLLSLHRDEESDYVRISGWHGDLYGEEIVRFEQLQVAKNYIRDFSGVSAMDFIDRVLANL